MPGPGKSLSRISSPGKSPSRISSPGKSPSRISSPGKSPSRTVQPGEEPDTDDPADTAPDVAPPGPPRRQPRCRRSSRARRSRSRNPRPALFQVGPIAAVSSHREPTEPQVDTARMVELLERVMAARPVAEWPLPIEDELETEPTRRPTTSRGMSCPCLCRPRRKSGNGPAPARARKRPPERLRSDTDRLQTAASPGQPGTKTPQTAALGALADKEPEPLEGIPPLPASPSKPTPMPSAKDILASHEARRRTQPAAVATKPAASPLAPTPAARARPVGRSGLGRRSAGGGPGAAARPDRRHLVVLVGRRFARGRRS